MNLLAKRSRLSRFAMLLPAGLVLSALVRWAIYGRPTTQSLDVIVISALVFAVVVSLLSEGRSDK